MDNCATFETMQADYLRLLRSYYQQLADLESSVGFSAAEKRVKAVRDQCILARTALHDHQFAHGCGAAEAERIGPRRAGRMERVAARGA